jgi:hypothetical protein
MSDLTFVFDEGELEPRYGDLASGILFEGEGQDMDQVSYGYVLTQDRLVLSENSWPEPGVVYVWTDQDILEVHRVEWPADTTLTLDVWLEYSGVRFEGSYTFTTPPDPPVPADP